MNTSNDNLVSTLNMNLVNLSDSVERMFCYAILQANNDMHIVSKTLDIYIGIRKRLYPDGLSKAPKKSNEFYTAICRLKRESVGYDDSGDINFFEPFCEKFCSGYKTCPIYIR